MNKDRRANLFTQVERVTEIPMLVLAFVFLAAILLPEIMHLSEAAQRMLEGVVWLIWAVFAVELGIKSYLAPDRRHYLVSHWPDVLTVALPFLRPLRLLRLFAVVSRTWTQTRTVLRQRTFSLVGLASLITVVFSATFVHVTERKTDGPIQTWGDALWWATTTITTVGYGDMYPTTAMGRGIAVFLMLTGITLFGLVTARIAAFFVEEDAQTDKERQLDEILERLKRIEQNITQQQGSDRQPHPEVSGQEQAEKGLPL
jgi:voltage-gated potassium channel